MLPFVTAGAMLSAAHQGKEFLPRTPYSPVHNAITSASSFAQATPVYRSRNAVFCSCVRIKLLKLDVRLIFFQISLCSSSGNYDYLIICSNLIQTLDYIIFVRYHAECYVHVWKCKIYFFCTLVCYGKVCKDNVYLSGL